MAILNDTTSVDIYTADDALDILTTQTPQVTFATIWPAAAKAFLEANSVNRRVIKRRVEEFTRTIKQGEWQCTPDALTFSWDGTVTNGQHRLHGCVEADQPIVALLYAGVEPGLRDVVDSGLKRTMSQVFSMKGEMNASHLASVTAQHWRYTKDIITPSATSGYNSSYNRSVSHNGLLKHLEEFPGLRDSVERTMAARHYGALMTPTAAGTLDYITHEIDADRSILFLDRVLKGLDVQRDTPEMVLRMRLLRARDTAGDKLLSDYQLGIGIKAWNAIRDDRVIHLLKINPTEAFPRAK